MQPAWSSGSRGLAENRRQTDGRHPDKPVSWFGEALSALDHREEAARPPLVFWVYSDRKTTFCLYYFSFLLTKESTLHLSWRKSAT